MREEGGPADAPALKTTQGTFGNPLFFDTDAVRTDMVPGGYVDYFPRMLPWQWGDASPAASPKAWLERPALYPLYALRAMRAAGAEK